MQPLTLIKTVVVFFFFQIHSSTPDLAADRAALLALRSAVGGRTFLWNVNQQSPCSWAGVRCDTNRVTALRLPGVALSGNLPTGVFGNLTSLRTLSLRVNVLSGDLPSDLALCTNLRNLYLQGNNFSGQIPDSLFSLRDLVRLNLADNSFTGEFPANFNSLTRLRTLFLENNQLSGSIPADLKLPKLEQLNVSNNLINGSIPTSLQTFDTSSFLGTSLCGQPLTSCSERINLPPNPNNGSSGSDGNDSTKKKLSGAAIAGIVVGSVVGFLVILILLIYLCRKARSNRTTRSVGVVSTKHTETEQAGENKPAGEVETDSYSYGHSAAVAAAPGGAKAVEPAVDIKRLIFFGNSARVFDLEDLLRASAEVLGKGTFGTAYKAVMESGTVMAVKRLRDVNVSADEFKQKIEAVGAMDHDNLVPLRAYFYSNDEKLLVFDYMPRGSLSALLHGNNVAGRTPLNWETRSSIALGTARGIEYLHSQGPTISHGNIKSSNVLLTQSYGARVSDFGLAHLVGPTSTPNRVAGYRAPEVTDPRRVSHKSDVYGFGVLLLEILTGKAPTHALLNEEGVDLPRWVQSVVREEWTSKVFDLDLQSELSSEEDMVRLLQLAIDCTAQYPDNRPSMMDVRSQIEEVCHSNAQKDHGIQLDDAV